MAKIKWTPEKYAQALRDTPDRKGLRSIVSGFLASDGYDLRRPHTWSPGQKRRVRTWYARVMALEAQETHIAKPRSRENLRRLQQSFHGDIPSRDMKVAFVPYVEPKTLPGAKKQKPRIRYTKTSIVIETGSYIKYYEPFNLDLLALDPAMEVSRVIEEMPTADVYYLQTGEYQGLVGYTGDRGFTQRVEQLMARYDGQTPFLRDSKKYGENPENHAWWNWLHGVYGYELKKRVGDNALKREIAEGMRLAKERRKQRLKITSRVKNAKKSKKAKKTNRRN